MLPPLFFKQGQPQCHEHKSLSLKQISRLNKASLVGCMVSGVVMGSIYGMMPLALNQGQFNTDQIGVLMAAIILGGMVVQPIISKLSVMMSKTLLLAMMCLVGVFAMGMTYLSNDYVVLIIALALLGMSSFALYPIAITLACDHVNASYIVAITQVMLLSYSVGSAMGPLGAGMFMSQASNGIMNFFFVVLLATAVYMLFASLRRKSHIVLN